MTIKKTRKFNKELDMTFNVLGVSMFLYKWLSCMCDKEIIFCT